MKKIFIGLFVFFGLAFHAYGASFNCGIAKSKVEKAICAEPELNKLDEQVGAAYKSALSNHPLPSYVKARQREWLHNNQLCEIKSLNECLKNNYQERLSQLAVSPKMKVFSNSKSFNYSNGDAVVTITTNAGTNKISVWGGFFINKNISEEQGKPTYIGCEFEGTFKSIGKLQVAVDTKKTEIQFSIKDDKLEFSEGTGEKICEGYGRLPENFVLLR